MKLTLIIENNQILQQTAEKLNISIDQLNKLVVDADPTGRKYKNFILKLLNKDNIRLPEDNYRVKETLENFIKYQRNLEFKDILKYNSLHELETALEPYIGSISKRQGGNNINPSSLPGVELILNNGEFKTYKVSDIESLKDIGEGTKWCTRRSYPDCQAEHYINTYNWIGVIYKDGKPFIQFTSDYSQVMDVNDEEVNFNISNLIPAPDLHDEVDILYNYARFVVNGRWRDIEPIIIESPHLIYSYACHVMKDRWYEAEPYIIQDPENAYYYARYVINDDSNHSKTIIRWYEAEPYIMKDPEYAYRYSVYIIKDKWPEAEPYIMQSPMFAFKYAYAHGRERWPEAEQYIIQDPEWAYQYAKDIIKDKWPEAEPVIYKSARVYREYLVFLYDLKEQAKKTRN